MKRIVSSLLVMVFMISIVFIPAVNVHAAESSADLGDFGEPISIITYVDEDGCQITEKIYFKSSEDTPSRDKSGSGWYMNEKEKKWASGQIMTYYAKGYFKWGDGEVSVSNDTGGCTNVPSNVTVSKKNVESGTGKYGLVFNNYAYVTYTCVVTDYLGNEDNLSVTIRVSESGNTI